MAALSWRTPAKMLPPYADSTVMSATGFPLRRNAAAVRASAIRAMMPSNVLRTAGRVMSLRSMMCSCHSGCACAKDAMPSHTRRPHARCRSM